MVDGYCFAGNAVIAGCSDLILASEGASLGMGGPAMIAGGGLGEVAAADVGPLSTMTANGVVDVAVDADDLGSSARRLLGYFLGPAEEWQAPDQEPLRDLVPERDRTSYDVLPIVETLCDRDSVTVLRPRFAPELCTALGRLEGRTVGVIANNTLVMAGALTSDAGDKAARFLQLCDAYGFPVLSLVDTPGMMVGPEAEETALVRHASRLLIAGARLTVPLVGVVLRRGYGLGAQAMLGGSTREPLMTLAWPGRTSGRWASRAPSASPCARSSRPSRTTTSASGRCASWWPAHRPTPRHSTWRGTSRSTTSSTRPRPGGSSRGSSRPRPRPAGRAAAAVRSTPGSAVHSPVPCPGGDSGRELLFRVAGCSPSSHLHHY